MSPRAAVARSSASSWPGCGPGPGPRKCTLMLLGRVSGFPELGHREGKGRLLRPGLHIGLTLILPSHFCVLAQALCSASPHLTFLPALQTVPAFQSLNQNCLLQEAFWDCSSLRLPSVSPVTKLICPSKSLNYSPGTKWFWAYFLVWFPRL